MSDIDVSRSLSVELTVADVVVLGAWLDSVDGKASDGWALDFAERQALWNLGAALEKADPHVFSEEWTSILEKAKRKLIGEQP